MLINEAHETIKKAEVKKCFNAQKKDSEIAKLKKLHADTKEEINEAKEKEAKKQEDFIKECKQERCQNCKMSDLGKQMRELKNKVKNTFDGIQKK